MNPAETQNSQPAIPSVEIVKMTPEWARQLLLRNPRNRRLRRMTMHGYAHDMRCGSWLLSPAMIALDTEGNLLDGQNRLWAVIESGETVEMLMGTGFSTDCFSVIDTGATRSMGDIITISHKVDHHQTEIRDPVACAAIARAVLLAERMPHLSWNGNAAAKGITKSVVLKEYNANQDLYKQAAKLTATAKARFKPLPRTPLGAMFVIAKRKNCVDIEQYVELVGSGEGLRKGSAILAMRSYLLNNPGTLGGSGRYQELLANFIKNFRQWRQGAEVSTFKPSSAIPLPSFVL